MVELLGLLVVGVASEAVLVASEARRLYIFRMIPFCATNSEFEMYLKLCNAAKPKSKSGTSIELNINSVFMYTMMLMPALFVPVITNNVESDFNSKVNLAFMWGWVPVTS